SSSAFGLMRWGAARPKDWTRAANGPSEVSTATRQPKVASRATTSAYQWSGTPGGSEPDSTTHDAEPAAATTDSVRASTAAVSSAAPGSLSLVVVPSLSVTARLVRTGVSVGTHRNGTAASCSAVIKGSAAGAGSSATASTDAEVRARATLTPLPPASVV